MNLTIVAGARPNFIKIAPIIHEIEKKNNVGCFFNYRLIHTGQHYDKNMSNSFFDELNIPEPSVNLNCSGGSQAEMTAKIMVEFEKELLDNATDLVIVVGDVTSTMACAIVAQKLKVKVAHIEGGIRSNDWAMPEEINRLVTDSISNYFFTTSATANNNLLKEGVKRENIFFVGNTMIDSLIKNQSRFKKPVFWNDFNIKNNNFFVVTLHRPSNVDEPKNLRNLINEIILSSNDCPIIFPMHPRTKIVFDKLNISDSRLFVVPPLSYLEFNYLVKFSLAVITDSGGISEETTVLNVPCITLRNSTERPETVIYGTNELIGDNPKSIKPALDKLFSGKWKKGSVPELWDGKTSQRIIKKLINLI